MRLEPWEIPTFREQKEGTTDTGRGSATLWCQHRVTEANSERGWSTDSNGKKAKEEDVWEYSLTIKKAVVIFKRAFLVYLWKQTPDAKS